MAKKVCAICKKNLGFFNKKISYANRVICSNCAKTARCLVCNKELRSAKAKILFNDGYFCPECMKKTGITSFSNSKSHTAEGIKSFIDVRLPLVQSFMPTKSIEKYLIVDEQHKAFRIGDDYFEYKNLLSFELSEDKQSVIKGGLGRAIIFGAVLGGAGTLFTLETAIMAGLTGLFVGAVTGGKKTSGICNSMKLRITLKDAHVDTVYIPFIVDKTPMKRSEYQEAQEMAQLCISALEIIADSNGTTKENANIVNSVYSEADEILKFKQLFDAGIITKEEFEGKKKQLLNLPENAIEAPEEAETNEEKVAEIAEEAAETVDKTE